MTRAVVLVERRPVERRVPRRDAAELAARFGHVVAVEPAPGRGRYRLTPRGYAGWFETATVRWVVRPKLAWANLARLLGTPSVSPATAFPDRFAALVADRLAALMRERAAAGLHREYREHREESATVRGRIDFAELARRSGPPGAAFPLVVSDLSADSPWNRVPVAAARRVLAVPGLAAESRANLAAAAETFAAGVGDGADSRELAGLTFTPATEPYRPLIGWCRVALGDGGLLVNLEHAFEEYVARVLGTPGNPAIDRHPDLRLTCDAGPAVRLVPDFVVRRGDNPVAVWDAKWKRLTAAGPDPADVQQVLGYAAVLGVRDAGLVYPGRQSGVVTFSGGAGVRLRVVKLRVSGPDAACERAAARLRRTVNFS